MHSSHMLLEIIKAGPDLVPATAITGSTLVRALVCIDTMDALFVASQVVYSSKSFPASFAVRNITLERLMVLQHVFSGLL
jgi:hypothetical protein